MTLAFSTSSPVAGIALIDAGGKVLWEAAEDAPRRASGACLSMLQTCLEELQIDLEEMDLFAADIGPGSFTGVRVGVTMAKTLGFLYERPVAGASAFDLINTDAVAVLPSRRGEFFVREPGLPAYRTTTLPKGRVSGFGPGIDEQTFPNAASFARFLDRLERSPAEAFIPEYLIEPSISIPKKPFPQGGRAGDDR